MNEGAVSEVGVDSVFWQTTVPPAFSRVDTCGGNQIDPGHDHDAGTIGGPLDDLGVSGGLGNAFVSNLHQLIGGLECFRQKAFDLGDVAEVSAYSGRLVPR